MLCRLLSPASWWFCLERPQHTPRCGSMPSDLQHANLPFVDNTYQVTAVEEAAVRWRSTRPAIMDPRSIWSGDSRVRSGQATRAGARILGRATGARLARGRMANKDVVCPPCTAHSTACCAPFPLGRRHQKGKVAASPLCCVGDTVPNIPTCHQASQPPTLHSKTMHPTERHTQSPAAMPTGAPVPRLRGPVHTGGARM